MACTGVFAWDEVPAVGDAKADRRVITGKAGDLKRVAIPAGTVADRHAHDFEQFFMVLEGTGVLTCAEGQIALQPGVVIHFEPQAWHSAVFETATVLVEVNFRKVGQVKREISAAEQGPKSTTCQIRFGNGEWEDVSVEDVLSRRERGELNFSIRCDECHGQVRAHRAGAGGAHFEHMQGNPGCTKGDCYDGEGSRLHPHAID